MDSMRGFLLPKWEFRNSFAALSMERDTGTMSAWGHRRDLSKTQFMMLKYILKRYKMGMQTVKSTWNIRVNLYSHTVLAEAKQHVKSGVPNNQNGAEYTTF